MSKPLEHDIVRPWLCCKACKNRYNTDLRRAAGRPVSIDRFKDGTEAAKRHDDRINVILEIMYG